MTDGKLSGKALKCERNQSADYAANCCTYCRAYHSVTTREMCHIPHKILLRVFFQSFLRGATIGFITSMLVCQCYFALSLFV